jgi:Tfp pilus assembly protein PilF
MKSLRLLAALGLGLAAIPAAFPLAGGIALAAEQDSVRPELGRPLTAAQELIKARKFRDALERLREADAITAKTAYETSAVEQLRLIAANGAGEPALAAKAYEGLAATGKAAQGDRIRYLQAIAVGFYQAKDYGAASQWGARYRSEGGADPQLRLLVAQAAYLAGDHAGAVKAVRDLAQGGAIPPEGALQLAADSYQKLGDAANAQVALEQLAAAYPKPEYWAELLRRISSRPGFADRLGLEVGRLRLALGGLGSAEQIVEQAELAVQGGLPGEAEAVLGQGFSTGLLGSGPEAERHRRLKDLVARAASEDRKTLPRLEQEAATAKDGNGLVAAGLAYLGYGQADKAVALIRQGIAKGGLKHPDDARLHLGLAQIKAGDKAGAQDSLQAVRGSDGAADIARLWLLRLRSA